MRKFTHHNFIVVICIVIIIMLAITSCGGKKNPEATTVGNNSSTTERPEETTAGNTEESTAESTTETTEETTTETTTETTAPAEKVTYKVTVTDKDGNSLAGATVQLCVGNQSVLSATTDSNGVATFELDKADYTVKVSLNGYTGKTSYSFKAGSTEMSVQLTKNAVDTSEETTTATTEAETTGSTGGDTCEHTGETTTARENETAATCTTAGSYDNVTLCANCGTALSRETVTVPATGEHRSDSTAYEDGKATCKMCNQPYDKYVNVLWDKYLLAEDMQGELGDKGDGIIQEISRHWTASLTDDGAKFVGNIKGNGSVNLGAGNMITVIEGNNVPNADYLFVKYKAHAGTTINIAEQSVDAAWGLVDNVISDGEWHVLIYKCATDAAYTLKFYFNSDSEDVTPVIEIAYAGFASSEEQITDFLEAKGDQALVPACEHRSASTENVCLVCGKTYEKYVNTLWDKYLLATDMTYTGVTPTLTETGVKFTAAPNESKFGNSILIIEGHEGVPNAEYMFIKYRVAEGTAFEIGLQSVGASWYWMGEGEPEKENNIAWDLLSADGEWHVLVFKCATDKAFTFKFYINAAEGTATVEVAYAGFAHTEEQVNAFVEAKGDTELVSRPSIEDETTGSTGGGTTEEETTGSTGGGTTEEETTGSTGGDTCEHTGETTTTRENEVPPTCAPGSYDLVTRCTECGTETNRERIAVDATGEHRSLSTDYVDGKATCTVCNQPYDKYVNVLWDKYLLAGEMGYTGVTPTLTETGVQFTAAPNESKFGNSILIIEGHEGVPNAEYMFIKYKAEVGTAFEIGLQSAGASWYWMGQGDPDEDQPGWNLLTADGKWHVLVFQCSTGSASTFKFYINAAEGTATVEVAYAGFAHTEDQVNAFVEAKGDSDYMGCKHTETTTNRVDGTAATCGVDGAYYMVTTCNACSAETAKETVVIPATGLHTELVEKAAAQAPTCTEAGKTAVMGCENCDAINEGGDVVDALGHEVTEEVTPAKDPTCTATGTTAVMGCKRCNYTEGGNVVAATGVHINGEAVKENNVAATCTKKGSYDNVVYCTVCETKISSQTVPVDATGHTEVDDPAVEATCTKTGLTAGKHCSVCNTVTVAQTEVSMKAHDLGDWYTTIEPTETTKGEQCRECKNCEYAETGVLAEKKHTHENCSIITLEAVAATCTTTGLKEGKKYSCGESITAQEIIPALGHTELKEKTPAKAPTCTEDGTTAVMGCERCNYTNGGDVVDATGHTEGAIPEKAPTCTEDGHTGGKQCVVCETVTVEPTKVDATGHTKGAVVKENDVAATCTKKGSYDNVVYCTVTVCKAEISRETVTVDATGNHIAESAVATIIDGKYYSHCTVCQGNYEQFVDSLFTRNDLFVGRTLKNTTGALTENLTVKFEGTVKGSASDLGAGNVISLIPDGDMLANSNYFFIKYKADAGTIVNIYLNAGDDGTGGWNMLDSNLFIADGEWHILVYDCAGTYADILNIYFNTASADSEDPIIEIAYAGFANSKEQINAFVQAKGDSDYLVCNHANTTTSREDVLDASCGADGYYTVEVRCTECNKIIESGNYKIPATGDHRSASTENVCLVCGKTYEKYVNTLWDKYLFATDMQGELGDNGAETSRHWTASLTANSAKFVGNIKGNGNENLGAGNMITVIEGNNVPNADYLFIKYKAHEGTTINIAVQSVGASWGLLENVISDGEWHVLVFKCATDRAQTLKFYFNSESADVTPVIEIAYAGFASSEEQITQFITSTCDHRSDSTAHDADHNAVCKECGATYQKYVDTLWDKYLFATDMVGELGNVNNAIQETSRHWTASLTANGTMFVGDIKGNSDLGKGNMITVIEDHPGVPNSEYFFVKYKAHAGTTLNIAEASVGGAWGLLENVISDGEWHVLVFKCATDRAQTLKFYFNSDSADVTPVIEIAYAGFASSEEQIDAFLVAKGDKPIPVETPVAPYVTAGSVTVAPGEEFTIDVRVGNNPGVWSFAFNMPIDTEIFEYVSCSTDGSIIQNAYKPEFDSTDNTFKCNMFATIEGAQPVNVTDDGTIVKITLKVKENVEVGNYTLDIQPVKEDILQVVYHDDPEKPATEEVVVEFLDVDCIVKVRNAQ